MDEAAVDKFISSVHANIKADDKALHA